MTKEIVPFTPPSAEEIMLIQPNNVTFGQYQITEWQENLLTVMADKCQKHMTREQQLPLDLFSQPYITIECDEVSGSRNKKKLLEELKDLRKKDFSFRWVHPKIHKTIETTGGVITTVHDIKGTNQLTVNINPWAIPFILYYGVGVGGTRYSKSIALSLRGNYTKRIYKIICSQRDKAEYFYPIEQFRKDMGIPQSKENAEITRDILKPSAERIKDFDSDVWFDFELICKSPAKGRKPKADTIIFKIHNKNPKEQKGEQFDTYAYVYRWMEWCFPTGNSKPLDITNKLSEEGNLLTVYKRAIYYDDRIASGEMTRDHAQNSLKKMLREQFKLK